MLNDEICYQILRTIEENPNMSQRELAGHLGVSLGKAHYCLKELVKKGLIKVGDFSTDPNKCVYAYLLTPTGRKERAQVTLRFLQWKLDEYEQIKAEITRLKSEVEQLEIPIEQK